MWNIHDLTAFQHRKPNYTRSWLLKLKNKRREARAGRKKGGVGFSAGTKGAIVDDSPSPSPVRSPDGRGGAFEEEKAMNSDYTSSDEDNGKGITIKGAA